MPEPKTPNQNFPRLTMQQAKEEMACFQKIYPLVRLVDLKTLATQPCYAPWKGRAPCRNCIGREALNCKGKKSKIEYLGSKAYQATAIYVEVDGVPYVMEMIQPLDADSPLTPNEVYELYRDVTTSAYNRRYYEDHLRRQHMAAGVAVIDLDDFKLYNDTFGHHAGDVALETTAHTIQECIRDSDMLIRYGGDELLLVLPDISGDDFVRKLRQIGLLIHEAVVPGYDKLQLSASIGGVLSAGRTIDEAFKEADKLMYQAKLQKNTVVTDHDCNVQPESTVHPRRSQQQILIVDDSEMNRAILAEMLGDSYIIHEAVNGEEALHDIGKIGIDEKILNKPGRLTKEEFEIMKTHTVIGANMLESLAIYQSEPLVRVAHDICRWHHERFDGKGYPDGLVGDEIPISAQVVSLADVYDALVSERVYKKAFSHERAIQMILNGECGAFNPVLLECLLEIQDTLKRELVEQSKNAYEYAAL